MRSELEAFAKATREYLDEVSTVGSAAAEPARHRMLDARNAWRAAGCPTGAERIAELEAEVESLKARLGAAQDPTNVMLAYESETWPEGDEEGQE